MTATVPFDFALLGSGFATSVLATVLQRMGYRCLLLESGQHPRFAIGESSTPIADQILLDLATDFDLPEIAALGRWSTAKDLEGVHVGCKRGFTYCFHRPGEPVGGPTPVPRVLVPASPSLESADSHWHRASVDHFLWRTADRRGVVVREKTRVVDLEPTTTGDGWLLSLQGADGAERSQCHATFLIDGTGPARAVARLLETRASRAGSVPLESWAYSDPGDWRFATRSGSLFGHFQHAIDWRQLASVWGWRENQDPYPSELAAVHHVTDRGWLWHLGFDHGVVSLGWVLPYDAWGGLDERSTPADRMEFWRSELQRFPRLEAMYREARLIDPPDGLRFVARQQRYVGPAAGPNWLALPSTVGFVDPLHSTGIAHSLVSVQKIVRLLQRGLPLDEAHLRLYSERLRAEFWVMDQLVSLAYSSAGQPEKWEAAAMLYFAAAIAFEEARVQRRLAETLPGGTAANEEVASRSESASSPDPVTVHRQALMTNQGPWGTPDFLFANSQAWLERVARAHRLLQQRKSPSKGWLLSMSEIIGPLNTAGLCDPSVSGIYQYTTAEK